MTGNVKKLTTPKARLVGPLVTQLGSACKENVLGWGAEYQEKVEDFPEIVRQWK